MSVLSEMGVTLQESLAPYDLEHGLVCFKQLHISSQGKDKQFQLLLTLTDTSTDNEERTGSTSASNSNDLSEGGTIQVGSEPKKPWVTLPSLPVHIISKPSKKTTRGNTPGVSNFGSVALFNRINSQTVRTKYLSSNDDGFTTSSSHWAPFEVEVVGADSALAPVVYGSRIVLKGTNGYRSHEYVIRKVEKHRSLAVDAGRQVSQMQKIALMRADLGPTPDGKVTYLSALVERSSVDIAVLPGSTHSTSWQLCEIKTQTGEDGNVSEYHEVNDYATWMITSIGTSSLFLEAID
jgi:recombining binding protein (suppressor of hairless)